MIEIKYCKDCRRYFDSDSYQCTSCGRSNVETQSLMQVLNWFSSEISYLHEYKDDKALEPSRLEINPKDD